MTSVATSDPTTGHDPFGALKERQQAMWASGDYATIGRTLTIVGERLCESADVGADERVLDVAAGNGNATLAAARRFARVTSTDYVTALLERGRLRAEAEGFDATFQQADAEALPFRDASFDVVLSTFGVMFTPNQERAAKQLLRVCRPGGRIGLAAWTPPGFLGQLFRLIGTHVPPAPSLPSPLRWGTEAHLQELFKDATTIAHRIRTFTFRYRSPDHWVEVFRSFYGPVHKAFEALDSERQKALEADLVALLSASNRGGATGLVVPAEY